MGDVFGSIPWGRVGEWSFDALGQVVAWSLIMIGFFGTFLPLIPGPILILVGALVHRLWLGAEHSLTWWTLGGLTLLLLLSILVEYLFSALGAKWYGSTKWGMWGAILGGLIGLFFGVFGLLLGPLVGAFAGEMLLARKRVAGSLKSTWGTLVGTAVGVLVKGGLALAMLVVILIDLSPIGW